MCGWCASSGVAVCVCSPLLMHPATLSLTLGASRTSTAHAASCCMLTCRSWNAPGKWAKKLSRYQASFAFRAAPVMLETVVFHPSCSCE
jgi:hypothetical protein